MKCFIVLLFSLSISYSFPQEEFKPYDPREKMDILRKENEQHKPDGTVQLKKPMHFLVFGDAKHSPRLKDVLELADRQKPQFCLTTADLVNKGAGTQGIKEYKMLDKEAGWFFRKYPTWPTIGNHEVAGGEYSSGEKNFGDFFGIYEATYSLTYGNAKFIALDWQKVTSDPQKHAWLEKELKEGQGKQIFIFRHRPFYTVGTKSHKDVEGTSTPTTELFDKYNVTAVFSGHDHIYYRTKRANTYHIISAGAGASIYPLKRENEAIEGDFYYGKIPNENKYKVHSDDGSEVELEKPIYYVVSVKIQDEQITLQMIDTDNKVWDTHTFTHKP